MNHQFRIILLAIFAFTFAIDRLSKSFADLISKWPGIGPVYFHSYSNPGFILQTFSDASALARIVFVSSLYGFIFFGFFFIQFLLPSALKSLRISLTIFFAAITSNCFDRAFYGAVTDFVCFDFQSRAVYFNVADIFMWVGIISGLVILYKTDKQIWHPTSKRKQYLVDQAYQYKWALQTSLIAFSATLILILFSYTYLKSVTTDDLRFNGAAYLMSASSLGLLFSALIFFAGVLFSHRSAGPLFAFRKYIEMLLDGKDIQFTLRKNDDHQYLIQMAKKLKNEFQKRQGDQNENDAA